MVVVVVMTVSCTNADSRLVSRTDSLNSWISTYMLVGTAKALMPRTVPTPALRRRPRCAAGDYSCLQAAFTLRRSLGFHLVQSYIPTILIVMISWVSFWMDVDSVPGRVTLGITTLLTMTTKSSGIQAEVPQVSYVKVRGRGAAGLLCEGKRGRGLEPSVKS